MTLLQHIAEDNKKFKEINPIIDDLLQDKLSSEQIQNNIIPHLRFLHNIGAIDLFHTVLQKLGEAYDDKIEILICRMLDAFQSFQYITMMQILQKINSHRNLSVSQKAIVAVNTIFANANGGAFDDFIENAIKDLESIIYHNNYLVFEGLENLMQELETRDPQRLSNYINFLNNYQSKSWLEYFTINQVLFNHYRRTNDFMQAKNLVTRYTNGMKQFSLTTEEKMKADIYLLRILFESRDSAWEDYSIQLFRNHSLFLNSDIEIALDFATQFFSIVRDAHEVFGRSLNEQCILEISSTILSAFHKFIEDNKTIQESLPIELCYPRKFFIDLHLNFLRAESVVNNYDARKYITELTKLQNNLLNLCRHNKNEREYLHWLLCFTDDLFSLRHEIDIRDELSSRVDQLESALGKAGFTGSVAYYLLFLARFMDYLQEDEKAKRILGEFNESGASYKAFNLSIQQIYLRLEDKYRLLPENPRRQLLDSVSLFQNLNSSREIEEALIRAEEKYNSIDFSDINYVTEVGIENVYDLLETCINIFLNASRFDLVDSVWQTFRHLQQKWKFSHEDLARIDLKYAVRLHRGYRMDEAYAIAEKISNADIHPLLKLHALILMGDIEAARSWPKFHFNSLSKALALAEQCNYSSEIARIYHKIGMFFCTHYPALGISFFRKAENLFHKLGMTDDLNEICLVRAQASLLINRAYAYKYNKTAQKNLTDPLLNEARRLLTEYPRYIFKSESSRAFHDRISGMFECSSSKFKNAYLFYSRAGAYHEILLTLESAVISLSIGGKKNEALEFADLYVKVVTERNDTDRIQHAQMMKKTLLEPFGTVIYPYISSPYPETTLLDILDDISFKEEIWALDQNPIRKYFPYPSDEGKCVAFKEGDVITLAPVALQPLTYYRGQSQRYQPSFPSIHRTNMSESQIFVERLKYCEFHLLLDTHPLTNRFKDTFRYKFPDGKEESLNFNVYHLALAQHYGIATELMDLTSDKWVAAFFASTKYSDGEYSPVKEKGKGIFYIRKENPREKSVINPIGIQPFSRPGEQRGYALPLKKGEDFEEGSLCIEFSHDPDISEFIFNYTNRSRKLFPDDILKEKADFIKGAHSFSKGAFEMARLKYYPATHEDTINEWLQIEKIEIIDRPQVSFTVNDMEEYRKNLPRLLQVIQENIIFLSLGNKTPEGINILYPTRN